MVVTILAVSFVSCGGDDNVVIMSLQPKGKVLIHLAGSGTAINSRPLKVTQFINIQQNKFKKICYISPVFVPLQHKNW